MSRPIVTNHALIAQVLAEYHSLQARTSHPDGKTDKGGRWYPAETERQDCCRVRSPSRAWPWSLMVHCRTLVHVASRRGLDPKIARLQLAKLIAFQRPAKTAPSGLCAICGASWTCEHQISESEAAGLHSISLTEAAHQFDRHLTRAVEA